MVADLYNMTYINAMLLNKVELEIILRVDNLAQNMTNCVYLLCKDSKSHEC